MISQGTVNSAHPSRCTAAGFRFSETHKLTGLQSCQPWSYPRLVAYSFLGSCEGAWGRHGDSVPQHTNRLTSRSILSLDPSVSSRTRWATTPDDPQGGNGLSVPDAQAACDFSCSASKCAPFFQIVRVMAAIFRANVRRAIAGFIPLLSKPW